MHSVCASSLTVCVWFVHFSIWMFHLKRKKWKNILPGAVSHSEKETPQSLLLGCDGWRSPVLIRWHSLSLRKLPGHGVGRGVEVSGLQAECSRRASKQEWEGPKKLEVVLSLKTRTWQELTEVVDVQWSSEDCGLWSPTDLGWPPRSIFYYLWDLEHLSSESLGYVPCTMGHWYQILLWRWKDMI